MAADAWSVLTADPAVTLLAVDFDGSLADIVADPEAAVPRPGVVALLTRLVDQFGRVAVVSGRPVEFLRSQLPIPGLRFEGQYGIERLVGDEVIVDPAALPYAGAVAAVATRADAELPGVFVERKGTVAVTLHWRRRAEMGDSAAAWAAAAAAEYGLIEYRTRMAVELRPPVAPDKGLAVSRLLEGMRVAMFAGDDHGDLAAFRALAAACAAGGLDHAVRIAVQSSEAPEELATETDLMVDGPAGLVNWLAELSRRV